MVCACRLTTYILCVCVCVCLPNFIYTTSHTTRLGEKMWSTFHLIIQYEAYILVGGGGRTTKDLVHTMPAYTSSIEFFFMCELYIYYCTIVKNSAHGCFILLNIKKRELKSKTIQAKTNKQTTTTKQQQQQQQQQQTKTKKLNKKELRKGTADCCIFTQSFITVISG